jgi:hypothetical protein
MRLGEKSKIATGSAVQVEDHAMLVAVPHSVARFRRRAVALGGLDLQHLGPEVGEQHRRHRPDQALRTVHHL